MKNQAKDHRPKIIDFPQTISGLQIASQQSILWPCYAYKVSIPSRRKKALNIFEETILKLCAIEKSNTENLSDITCLNKEIVKFIQCRLSQLNLLSDRFELNKKANELLNQWDNEPEEYVAATVYVDLIGGNLLPVVKDGKIKLETVIELKGNTVRFETGSRGQKSEKSAIKLIPDLKSFGMNVPSSDNVAKTIRAHKRIHKRFSMLNESENSISPFYSKADAITVQREADLVFLHCKVIVQKGNPDFIVTDPFGYGFSSIFKESLEKSNAGWLIKVKERALQEKIVTSAPNVKENKLQMFSDSIDQYPQIKHFLIRAEINWEKSNEAVKTSSQERESQSAIRNTLKYLYDALEWTLRQVVFENPVEQWEHIFSFQSYKDNDRLLLEMAKKIGFVIPKTGSSLLQVKPGKIKAFSSGVVEMQPLLTLAIAGASQGTWHPFKNMAINDSNSLSFIAKLKEFRDEAAHGNITEKNIELNDLSYYREGVHKLITNLYPVLRCNADNLNLDNTLPKSHDIDQLRLKARINLDSYFGFSTVAVMPSNLLEELVRTELLLNNFDKNQGSLYAIINTLAAVLQIALFTPLRELRNKYKGDEELTVLAQETAIKANFSLSDEKLPKSILTVNRKRIKQACNGMSSTLGANLLALLILLPDEKLLTISGCVPDMISFVGRIVDLRCHGNMLQQTFLNDELLELKENAFKVTKCLLGV